MVKTHKTHPSRLLILAALTVGLALAGATTWPAAQTYIFPKVLVSGTQAEPLVVNRADTTAGPNVFLDSGHTAGSGYLGSVVYRLTGSEVAAVRGKEFVADHYGLSFHCFDEGGPYECARVTGAGEFTVPRQPGVLAYNSATDTNVISNAAIDFDTEVYDETGNFANDTFTAPITGRYLLCGGAQLISDDASQLLAIIVQTSNRNYWLGQFKAVNASDASAIIGCAIADMESGDTALVALNVTVNSADVQGDPTSLRTFFTGLLQP